ncbi:MAG: hypothetical protein H0T43_06090, partial [Solirubrobacterales bacterium]|nr:hypothetical protein [Solirubrobacterales bacterium]
MASLESLPADQRAVLQLLLKQGKSYEELSALLRIDTTAVRERAHDAVAALGPESAGVSSDRTDEIADYLLGQQSASQRAATREYLEGSAAGRAWARTTAGTLKPLAGEDLPLPDIPAERAEVDEAFDALDRRTARRDEVQRSSKTGSLLLLGGLGIVVAVVLILLLSGGDDDPDTASTPQTQTTATPQILGQADLNPPEGSDDDADGVAFVVRQGGQLGLAIQAQGLARSREGSAYGVWLSNSPGNSRFLGFIQTPVGENGTLQSVSALEQGTDGFRELLLTRESQENPERPGNVVLRGQIAAPSPEAGGAGGATPAPPGGGAQTA